MNPQRFKEKYGEKYRVRMIKDDNGVVVDAVIMTRFPKRKEEDGNCPFEIWQHGEGVMAVLLPSKTARKILKDFSQTSMYLSCQDGWILHFREEDLKKMTSALKIRTRRKASPEQLQKLAEMGRAYLYSKKPTA